MSLNNFQKLAKPSKIGICELVFSGAMSSVWVRFFESRPITGFGAIFIFDIFYYDFGHGKQTLKRPSEN